MRFFFLTHSPEELTGSWTAPPELHRHLKALRFQPQEEFLLLLPQGGAIKATMPGPQEPLLLHGLCEIPQLPLLPITLATAWPKGSRGDDLIVRATEAGVSRILPLICDRSTVGKSGFSSNRTTRWRKLARETCEQAGRPVVPTIEDHMLTLSQALVETPAARPIVLSPGSWPLAMELTLSPPKELLLFIGPEGGFSSEEDSWFEQQKITRAGLLPTILRIEAAGPAALVVCQHWFYQLNAD
ncbi:MAG: 16S rRNA (uracil(1498)-N(3))-methyltransferase [Planctomycetes bacterium]|nr:16S rRNA (uracil(1498)-N(3))-methyltransferase [Planctomycetota bacterium]